MPREAALLEGEDGKALSHGRNLDGQIGGDTCESTTVLAIVFWSQQRLEFGARLRGILSEIRSPQELSGLKGGALAWFTSHRLRPGFAG